MAYASLSLQHLIWLADFHVHCFVLIDFRVLLYCCHIYSGNDNFDSGLFSFCWQHMSYEAQESDKGSVLCGILAFIAWSDLLLEMLHHCHSTIKLKTGARYSHEWIALVFWRGSFLGKICINDTLSSIMHKLCKWWKNKESPQFSMWHELN